MQQLTLLSRIDMVAADRFEKKEIDHIALFRAGA
jgi:hypothetical protein